MTQIEKLRGLRAQVEENPIEFTVAGETEEDVDNFIRYYNRAHNLMPTLLDAMDLLRVAINTIEDEFPGDDDRFEVVTRYRELMSRLK